MASENVENTPVKENTEEDEPESRTKAFVKKRSIPLPATLQSYQEEKMMRGNSSSSSDPFGDTFALGVRLFVAFVV